MMRKLCQKVLDGKGMPDDWKTSVVVRYQSIMEKMP